ncbi:Translocation protein [Mycena kentingensis (nom. inval.)]|nr:Translocation protein [Mycena kentingensis (nom. inval.)]
MPSPLVFRAFIAAMVVLAALFTLFRASDHVNSPLRLKFLMPTTALPIPAEAFVVNLPRRKDRREDMERLRVGLGLERWEYVAAEDTSSAVVGRILQRVKAIRKEAFKRSGEYVELGNKTRLPFSWPDPLRYQQHDVFDEAALANAFDSAVEAEPPLTCAEQDFTVQPYWPSMKEYRLLTRNRVACWRSHLSILQRQVHKQVATLVMEDDVDMEVDIRARLGRVWEALPQDWDMVFLGHCRSNESYHSPLPTNRQVHSTRLHPSNAPLCTHAYVVSPSGIERVLAHLTYPPFAYSRSIDRALAWLVQSGRIKAYSVVPSIVVQRKMDASDVAIGKPENETWRDRLEHGFFVSFANAFILAPADWFCSLMEQQAKAPPELRKVAVFLRTGNAGIKVRVGALNGKRFDYFKGKSAIKALLSPAYGKLKGVPKITNEAEAIQTLAGVNSFAFFLRVQRGAASGSSSSSPKTLQVIPEQKFTPDEYYVWFFEGSQWTTYAGAILMVGVMLAGVMFPLWPPIMRQGVYYLSMGMLGLIGLFFAIAIVRLIFYIITVVVASPGIWIFPKLFADVGFVESFIPLYEWDLPKKKSKKKRGEKGEKAKAGAVADANGGGAFIEEIDDSGASRPQSRSARVEEVEDEDDA